MATSFDSTLATLGIGRTGANPASQGKGLEQMNQSDFIALMTAQMKNQDPFEPVDNTQMVAQMAQFSSLAGISEMSSTLKAMADKLSGSSSEALAFVGKTVLTAGNTAYPRAAGGFAGSLEIDGPASQISLTIANASGEVLKSVDLGAHPKGFVNYDWDGTTDSGEPAGDGPFTVTAKAVNDGKSVTGRTLVWAPVTSVTMPSGGSPELAVLGVGSIDPSAVRAVA